MKNWCLSSYSLLLVLFWYASSFDVSVTLASSTIASSSDSAPTSLKQEFGDDGFELSDQQRDASCRHGRGSCFRKKRTSVKSGKRDLKKIIVVGGKKPILKKNPDTRMLGGLPALKSVVKKVLQLAVMKLDRKEGKTREKKTSPSELPPNFYNLETTNIGYYPDNSDAFSKYKPDKEVGPDHKQDGKDSRRVGPSDVGKKQMISGRLRKTRQKGKTPSIEDTQLMLEALVSTTSELQRQIQTQYQQQMDLKQQLKMEQVKQKDLLANTH